MENMLSRKIFTIFQRAAVNSCLHGVHYYTTRAAVGLAYKVYGNIDKSTPIIIIHGLLGCKKNWDSMSKKLMKSTDRPVIAVDARNHGHSPFSNSHTYLDLASDIDRLLNTLNLKEAILIGHSMGGRTAMVYALTEPTRVPSLIVVDISPVSFPTKNSDFFLRLMDVMNTVKFEENNIPKAKEAARYKLKASGLINSLPFMNFLLMNVGEKNDKVGWLCNIKVLKKHFEEIASFPGEVADKVYQGPTLFVAGTNSLFLPQSDLLKIKAMFPQVTVQYVEKAGHNVHMDNPDKFQEIVTRFIMEYAIK